MMIKASPKINNKIQIFIMEFISTATEITEACPILFCWIVLFTYWAQRYYAFKQILMKTVKQPRRSAPARGQILGGALMVENFVKFQPGSSNFIPIPRTVWLSTGIWFWVEIVPQISPLSLPICSQDFTYEACCTGKLTSYAETNLASILLQGKSPR